MRGGCRPWCPWSSAHYPWFTTTGKAGQGSGKPLKDGVAHEVIDLESGMLYRIKEDEVRDFISKLSGRFEVRAPSLEDVYLEVMKSA